jgi:tetratricopeptide (TPR) repeat protein
MHLRKDADALAVLRSVLQSDKENPEANSLTGRLLLKAGKHEPALECLSHAWRLKPEAATAAALGKCYYALGKTAKAKSYLQRAIARDIRDPENSFLLGRICLDRGQGALAEKYLLMAHEAGRDSLELHRMLGRAYLLQRKYVGPIQVRQLGKPARAGERVDGHIVLAADESRPRQHKLATIYCALHEGLVILKRAPMDKDGLFMTARGWHAAGRADLAGKALKTLGAVEPKTRRVLLLRAEAALSAGEAGALDKALAAARTARVLSAAELAEIRYRQALALRAAGKRGEALKAFARAAQDAPTSGKILRSLASLSRALGKTADARQYYARLVELAPDAADIDELRNALKVLQESKEPRR